MKPSNTGRCTGCRQVVDEADLTQMRAGRQCGRCLTPDPRYRYGGPGEPYSPSAERRGEVADAMRVPSESRVEQLRRRGDELRQLGEQSERASRLAYHEAGHSVVAYALKIPLQRVAIDVHGGEGITERGQGGAMWTTHDAAAWLYGGQLAEEQRFGRSVGAVDDNEVLRDLAAVARGGELDQARAYARDVLGRNWAAVSALAGELIRRRALDAYDVEAVLATRMRRGAEQRDASVAAVTVDRRAIAAEAGRVDIRQFEELRGLGWDDAVAEVARRSGVSTAGAQEAFNQHCRRKYGIETRSLERTYPFAAA